MYLYSLKIQKYFSKPFFKINDNDSEEKNRIIENLLGIFHQSLNSEIRYRNRLQDC